MSEYTIQWTEPADDDLDEISDYLIRQEGDFFVAEKVVKRLLAAPVHLASFPWAGKPGRRPDTREWRVEKTRYSLVYTVHNDTISVLRVMHSSRLFPDQPAEAESADGNDRLPEE